MRTLRTVRTVAYADVVNYISNNLDVEGLRNRLAYDGEGDRPMDRPAHFFDRILKSKALKIHLINRRDNIF